MGPQHSACLNHVRHQAAEVEFPLATGHRQSLSSSSTLGPKKYKHPSALSHRAYLMKQLQLPNKAIKAELLESATGWAMHLRTHAPMHLCTYALMHQQFSRLEHVSEQYT